MIRLNGTSFIENRISHFDMKTPFRGFALEILPKLFHFLLFLKRDSFLHSRLNLVNNHSQYNNSAFDHLLPERGNAHHHQAIVQVRR
jgi:hypothetical protein